LPFHQETDRMSVCSENPHDRSARFGAHGKAVFLATCGALCVLLVSACSDSHSGGGTSSGPAADVSEELSGGNGIFMGSPYPFAAPDGYVDHEYVAAGTATDYQPKVTLTDDGRWSFVPNTTAPYRTRVVVRRPVNTAQASGTVIVEWLNVSGGVDADPEYVSLEEEIIRRGHIWVGVSAQIIGVEGGPVLVTVPGGGDLPGKGIKKIDPARYGSLQHPGDGYSFDIYTQVARAVEKGGGLLGGAKPKLVIAAGESQSAIALTTYYDGVQPLTLVFDGFFLHSRASVALPLVGPGQFADISGSLTTSVHPVLRDDLDAPVMDIQAESDVTGILNSSVVHQPDSARFRLWEVTGTSHADAHLVGPMASMIDCGAPINNGPMHLVAKAAFRALDTWLRTGNPPPLAPRIELTNASPINPVRDSDGIALGGLRTPPVDVPVDVLSGVPGPDPSVICILLGSTKPLSDARLAELYPNRATYVQEYDAATDRTIQAGFVLEPDRAALLAFAQPNRINP
jgi:hypothetical protein